MWGKGDDNKHCRDCWILEVDSMKWKPVSTLDTGVLYIL